MASSAGGARGKRYNKEIKKLAAAVAKCGGDITVEPNMNGDGKAADFTWRCSFPGPEKYMVNGKERASPFKGKTIVLELKFPTEYPFKAPEPRFVPTLYHPNVQQKDEDGGKAGSLCNDFIKSHWAPTSKAVDFVNDVRHLVAQPDLKAPLDNDIAEQMLKHITQYEAHVAKVM